MALPESELSRTMRAPVMRLAAPLPPEALEPAFRAFHSSYYVEHPFHVRMHAGELTPGQLRGWVANRLAYQRAIPRKDAAIISNCPDPAVRRSWVRRIVDHDGARAGEGGIELWIRLGEALGVPRAEMEDERHVLPAVRAIAESYVEFCRTHDWVSGVASSLTELFAPDIMRRRLESLPRHYPWIRDDAYAYFRGRLTQAPRDSAEALDIVRAHCTTLETQQRAIAALGFKLSMLWSMIDAIDLGTRGQ
jgi:pyrroloquinoline-quinone synthase